MPSRYRTRVDEKAFRRAAKKLRATSRVCHICGRKIDTSLPRWDPVTGIENGDSWSADHVEPVSASGTLTGEIRAAHLRCNQDRGDTPLTEYKVTTLPTTRKW